MQGAWVLSVVGELKSHMPYDTVNLPPLPAPNKQTIANHLPKKQTIKPHVILSSSLEKGLKKKSKQKRNVRRLRKLELKLYLAVKWPWELENLLNHPVSQILHLQMRD